MHSPGDSTRILRTAAWIWIGYLLAMAFMDFVLYTLIQLPVVQNIPLQPGLPGQPLPPLNPRPFIGPRFTPVYLFYVLNSLIACTFLFFTHWDWIREDLGRFYYPLLLFAISTAPIVINL